jgi:hypothetical protein
VVFQGSTYQEQVLMVFSFSQFGSNGAELRERAIINTVVRRLDFDPPPTSVGGIQLPVLIAPAVNSQVNLIDSRLPRI